MELFHSSAANANNCKGQQLFVTSYLTASIFIKCRRTERGFVIAHVLEACIETLHNGSSKNGGRFGNGPYMWRSCFDLRYVLVKEGRKNVMVGRVQTRTYALWLFLPFPVLYCIRKFFKITLFVLSTFFWITLYTLSKIFMNYPVYNWWRRLTLSLLIMTTVSCDIFSRY